MLELQTEIEKWGELFLLECIFENKLLGEDTNTAMDYIGKIGRTLPRLIYQKIRTELRAIPIPF